MLKEARYIISLPLKKKINQKLTSKEKKLILDLTKNFNNLGLTFDIISILDLWNKNLKKHNLIIERFLKKC